MSDGRNTVSRSSINEAITEARNAGTPVFVMGYGDVDQTVLNRIARETGGTYQRSLSTSGLRSLLQAPGRVISNQYEIAYTTSDPRVGDSV